MVVLAAAVTTKMGKLLLSRQYIDMSRIRIEGLLAAFPKLVGTEKQHTYVETDAVRYVYQPVEMLYVLLITTKNSNIVEDLETLRLLGKILPEYSPRYGSVSEETVLEASFEIVHSFDEVIDWGGYRENVNLPQIATFIEMYSHEDRLAKMIKESKMQEAKEEMRRKAQSIQKQRGGNDALGLFGAEIGNIMKSSGLGGLADDLGLTKPTLVNSSDYGGKGGISSAQYANQNPQYAMDQMAAQGGYDQGGLGIGSDSYGRGQAMGFGGMGMGVEGFGAPPQQHKPATMSFDRPSNAPTISGAAVGKGMSLGKPKKQDHLLDAMRAEGEVVDILPTIQKGSAAVQNTSAFISATEAIHLSSIEKMVVAINRDGGVEKLEVKGDLLLRVSDPEKALIKVGVQMGENSKMQLRTHPNIDKASFTSYGVLGLKDPKRPFPTGNPLGILRWRMETKDEEMLPLLINCWPSESGDECQVNIEYELVHAKELKDVVISIPCHTGGTPPNVLQVDGDFRYNQRTQVLEWVIPMIDQSNKQGTMEFSTPVMDPGSFFPVNLSFNSQQLYCQMKIGGVQNALSGEPVKYSQEISLTPEEYSIV